MIHSGRNVEKSENWGDKETKLKRLDTIINDLDNVIGTKYEYEELGNNLFKNISLFRDLVYTNTNTNSTYNEIYNAVIQKLEEYKAELKNIETSLDDSLIDQIRKSKINTTDKLLDIVIMALPFELEKMGKDSGLSMEQRIAHVNTIQAIESELFGGRVIDNEQEVIGSIRILQDMYDKDVVRGAESRLMDHERERFSSYIQQLQQYAGEHKTDSNEKTLGNTVQHKELETKLQVTNEQKFDAEKMKKVFELIYTLYEISKDVVISAHISSVKNTLHTLYIPHKRETSLMELFSLIQHEVETHGLIDENNKHLLGDLKGSDYVDKEEGTASTMENMMKGKELYQMEIRESIPQIALGEILNGKEFEEFISLYAKLKWPLKWEEKTKEIILRRKRNYPFDLPGVQHKDTAYSRGYQEVLKRISEGADPLEAFYNKVSFSDMEKLRNINKERTSDKDRNPYIKPMLLGEVLFYAIANGSINEKDFKHYIKEKYNFLKDEHIEGSFTFSQKRTLVELLKALKE